MSERHERIEALTERADACHGAVCHGYRELFSLIAEIDRRELWRGSGARDMAHWLWMRYGLSEWKARRWISCAHALERLPRIAQAFAAGVLGVDKVVELTRLATPQTERGLIQWAERVASGRIRREAELARRRSMEEAREDEGARSVSWWYSEDGRRFGLEADLPAAQGAVVQRAIDRLAERIPVMPGEQDAYFLPARRADALVALASRTVANDPDPDRATVVVHAQLEGLVDGTNGCQLEEGPAIHPEAARRLLCTARVQTVIEDGSRQPLGVGRMSREPSAWMLRQLRYRDHGCTFPGCGSRLFTHAHHVVWWEHGGRTDLDNLVLVCSFHHRLVHEHGWSLKRDPDGTVRWSGPTGRGTELVLGRRAKQPNPSWPWQPGPELPLTRVPTSPG